MTVRPVASDKRAIKPSFSSAARPPPDWMMPVPISRSTSPSAKISFSSAHKRRDVDALRVVMALVARHRQAERAALDAVAHDVLHLLDFVVGRGAPLALVAHHVVAHRRMADQIADIDAEMLVEPVHVLRDRLPIDLDGVEHLHRDRFDIGQKLGDPLCGARTNRRQGQRAIAEDDRGAAVVGRERAQRVPRDLRVVMAVIVDKAGRDDLPRGVDRALGRPAQLADLGDLAVLDADISAKRRHSGAVDDPAVLDQQIIRHRYPFLGSGLNLPFARKKCSTGKPAHPCEMRRSSCPRRMIVHPGAATRYTSASARRSSVANGPSPSRQR